jgi:hypothetical protein
VALNFNALSVKYFFLQATKDIFTASKLRMFSITVVAVFLIRNIQIANELLI